MNIFKKAWVLVLVVVIVAGCVGTGPHAVKGGIATEFIMNSETRQNGAHMVWLGNDTATVYCTFNNDLYEKALSYQDDRISVTITYSTINNGDSDGDNGIGGGCGAEKDAVVMRLEGIRPSRMAEKTMTAEAKQKPL